MFEAQITRTVSDHIADLYNSSATSGSLVRQEISGEGCVSPTVDAAELVGDHLKRKRSGFPGSKDIIEVSTSWNNVITQSNSAAAAMTIVFIFRVWVYRFVGAFYLVEKISEA